MVLATSLNQEQIKEINRINIINNIKNKQETTKQEIAKQLGLSIPTATSNINLLIEEGYVEEAGMAESTGGRKPMILRFVEDARFSFGVDITPERVKLVLINLNAKIIDESQFVYEREYSFADVLVVLEDEVKKMIKRNRVYKKVLGVGISLPGLVDEDRNILENAPNLGVRDFDFSGFEKSIGLRVSIENEANVAAFAETVLGEAKDKTNLVYISVTEGVGTGIIINDHIYKSQKKKAGEFGHMRVSDEILKCNCGRTGCWELYASKKALFKYYKEYTNERVLSLDEVFYALAKGNDGVKAAVEKYIDQLFVGIENIILGLNPEYVIIGGELGAYQEQMINLVNDGSHLKSTYTEYEGTKVLFSSLKDSGSLMGAALLPQEAIFNFSKSIL